MLEKFSRRRTLFSLACGKVNLIVFSEVYGSRCGQPKRYSAQAARSLINLLKKIGKKTEICAYKCLWYWKLEMSKLSKDKDQLNYRNTACVPQMVVQKSCITLGLLEWALECGSVGKSWLHKSLFGWSWISYLMSPYLGVLICKMGNYQP